MAEVDFNRAADIRTRVEDYLNDKIQTAADLEQVNILLSRVQEQQGLLRKQVLQPRRHRCYDCSHDYSWTMLGGANERRKARPNSARKS